VLSWTRQIYMLRRLIGGKKHLVAFVCLSETKTICLENRRISATALSTVEISGGYPDEPILHMHRSVVPSFDLCHHNTLLDSSPESESSVLLPLPDVFNTRVCLHSEHSKDSSNQLTPQYNSISTIQSRNSCAIGGHTFCIYSLIWLILRKFTSFYPFLSY
jgi:hypothetical protein